MRYSNLDEVGVTGSFRDLLQWQRERRRKRKDLSYHHPQAKIKEVSWLKGNRDVPAITFIGHSTVLIQLGGVNMITDPVWASWLGMYRRLTEPGLRLDELPEIDIVLLSHSHYDHLHYQSIKRLPGKPKYFVPAGLKRAFERRGLSDVQEFKWWDRVEFKSLSLTFVPAQHWTKRTLFDTNRSHWGGWVIEPDNGPTVYYAGDSGYFRGFKEIGERFSIDYCLMPIGAYEPEWFMKEQHVNPEEAIQAFLDTKAGHMIPIHFGAFMLADDTPKEALDRMHAEWDRLKMDPNHLHVLQLGESRKLTLGFGCVRSG
nr:MBL fold metallo-hydrolase [Sporosarcina cyprini]